MKPISNLIVKMKPSGIGEYFNYASERPEVVSLGVGELVFATPLPILMLKECALNIIKEENIYYCHLKN